MTVCVVARFTVKAENAKAFRGFMDKLSAGVREHEVGRTLAYSYYLTEPGGNRWLLHEAYADAEAMIAHFQRFSPIAAGAVGLYEIESMIIAGPVPPDMLEHHKAILGSKIDCYPVLLSTAP